MDIYLYTVNISVSWCTGPTVLFSSNWAVETALNLIDQRVTLDKS